ncbi:hypothetical protein HD554DRAFT_2017649, partial [Boletus coccyginus]
SDKPGHQKLHDLCKVVHENHSAEFVWLDTCCINKKEGEHVGSVWSMYHWYANAPLCIVYLEDTINTSDLEHNKWFARGWTLQELLVPKKLKFYNKNWLPLTNVKNNKELPVMAAQIEHVMILFLHY